MEAARRQLVHLASAIGQPVVDLLLPPRCACCGDESESFADEILLCPACRNGFADTTANRCQRCGAVAAGACLACAKRRPRFDRMIALGPYAAELRGVVLQLKRPGHEALAAAMGSFLAERLRMTFKTDDQPLDAATVQVMPTPMHWMRRLRQRTNSAELLAAALADRLLLPLSDDALTRRRNTRKQGPMLRTERLQNVRGAFQLRFADRIQGAHVILVDDVVTTGATCDEMARVLKQAGARRVTVTALARADAPR